MTRFERDWNVVPGSGINVSETSIGRMAVAICDDVEFPECARAAARAGAHVYRLAQEMSPREYVTRVERAELSDPTLSFQLRRGFRVLAVVSGYLRHDPESLGFAALIEWLNPNAPENTTVPGTASASDRVERNDQD